MKWLVLLCLLPASVSGNEPVPVTVLPLSGAPLSGSLWKLDREQLVVEVNGEQRALALRDVMALTTGRPEPGPAADATYLQLVDGSQLVGKDYRVANRVAQLQVGGRTTELETRNIRSVRFHAPAQALDDQWNEMVVGQSQGDVIVLRRSDTALDKLEGVFHDVTGEAVEFAYEDERIPVKRGRLEGMIYFHPVDRQLPNPVCIVHEASGSHWRARSVDWQQDQLVVTTASGVRVEIPWNDITRLDFSQGNVVQLSDLTYDLVVCEPFYASRLPQESIRQTYGPRRNGSFSGDSLWLTDAEGVVQKFDQGLSLHSRTELVFRLTEPYRRLTAVVGIDSRPRQRGNLVLVIAGDNTELFRRTISGQDAPLNLDLDITGVRRLRILVDYGDSLDVADHLNLCNARLIK
jgi:hypothetical protein